MSAEELSHRLGTRKKPAPIDEWESATEGIFLPVRKLEKLAEATRAPYGMLFLSRPPEEPLPVRDFRAAPRRAAPSLQLRETVNEIHLRQSWLSEALQEDGAAQLPFIGSVTIKSAVSETAQTIRETLHIRTQDRPNGLRPENMALWLIGRLEEVGINAVRKGYAGTATRRALDREEFKGFALADRFAPWIFINGKDWPNSQIFTLAHECVHLWLGESALPNGEWFEDVDEPVEQFCNAVAAELLTPVAELREFWPSQGSATEKAKKASQHFKVSSLATLFRAGNSDLIDNKTMKSAWNELKIDFQSANPSPSINSGGSYYNNQGVGLGKQFLRQVLSRTLTGRTTYSEAFKLIGTQKTDVLLNLAKHFLQGAS